MPGTAARDSSPSGEVRWMERGRIRLGSGPRVQNSAMDYSGLPLRQQLELLASTPGPRAVPWAPLEALWEAIDCLPKLD
jgi:hypothetical protein